MAEEIMGLRARYMAAWGAAKNPPLDAANPHFRNRYASLPSVLKAVREACEPFGIAYEQHLSGGRLVTMVTDGDEVLQLSDMALNDQAKSQEVGSDLTYRKRQLACLDFGIVGEDDDDAEGGSQYAPVPQPDALADTWRRCLALGIDAEGLKEHMRASYGKTALSQLSQAERMAMLQHLQQLAKDKETLNARSAK